MKKIIITIIASVILVLAGFAAPSYASIGNHAPPYEPPHSLVGRGATLAPAPVPKIVFTKVSSTLWNVTVKTGTTSVHVGSILKENGKYMAISNTDADDPLTGGEILGVEKTLALAERHFALAV